MAIEVITKEDLLQFKVELLEEIKKLLAAFNPKPMKEWMKGNEVRKLLGISAGTLQNFRVSGKLQSSKIGGIHFYRYSDIDRLLEDNFPKP